MIATVPIRLAMRADAAAIAELSRDAIEHGLPWRWTTPRVQRAIDDARTNVAVAHDDAMLLGFGIMQYAGDEAAHLQLLAVHPAQRREGIGSALLVWLEEVARAAGLPRIGLEARLDNVSGRCFYSEHGYHERCIVARMYCGRLDGVRMQKWLRPAAR